MKILTLCPVPLYPWRRGLEHRIYHFLKPLCKKHEISQLSFSSETPVTSEELAHIDQLFDLVVTVDHTDLPSRPKESPFKRIIEWFAPTSVNFGGMQTSPAMQKKFDELLAENSFDLIFVASPYMLNYVLNETKLPVLFEAIDDSSLLFKREIALRNGALAKLKAFKDWLVVRQAEKKFYSRFKEIVLTSPVDAESMRKLCPHSNITVIPNGVDARTFDDLTDRDEKPTLIFIGVMNYSPNETAMLYFIRKVFPLIKAKQSDVQLLVVGRDPTPQLIELGESVTGVEVTGSVDEIKPFLSRAWVYVCPIISGAGIKNKVLEAWASETPLVATSLSCDGINVSPDDDLLVADSPEEFAEATLRLLNDQELSERLAKTAKKKVLAEYDWESKAIALEQQFNLAIESHHVD